MGERNRGGTLNFHCKIMHTLTELPVSLGFANDETIVNVNQCQSRNVHETFEQCASCAFSTANNIGEAQIELESSQVVQTPPRMFVFYS